MGAFEMVFRPKERVLPGMVLLLFSDHIWFVCGEDEYTDFIEDHKWADPCPMKYVIVIDSWNCMNTIYLN